MKTRLADMQESLLELRKQADEYQSSVAQFSKPEYLYTTQAIFIAFGGCIDEFLGVVYELQKNKEVQLECTQENC